LSVGCYHDVGVSPTSCGRLGFAEERPDFLETELSESDDPSDRPFTIGVKKVDRITRGIRIEVLLVFVPHRIRLQEPPERRRVHPRLVIIEAELAQPCLAGVLEPPDVGSGRHAIFVIGVEARRAGVAVGDADDRAEVIGVEVAHGAGPGADVPHERVVGRGVGAVDVAADERVGGVIFRDQRVAVRPEPRVAGPLRLRSGQASPLATGGRAGRR
jgi:hypothetical protein